MSDFAYRSIISFVAHKSVDSVGLRYQQVGTGYWPEPDNTPTETGLPRVNTAINSAELAYPASAAYRVYPAPHAAMQRALARRDPYNAKHVVAGKVTNIGNALENNWSS
ncbi:MAG: hypothetical protein JSU95_18480 [Betaproteobacteria bacterium]|nr:MAG: hypothetical protein JSU95_18480 [Betaproteobacteria bacterium]